MDKHLKKILRRLETLGFRVTNGDGSLKKIYPPDKSKPFYSLHASNGKGFHNFRRWASQNWQIDITAI